MFFTAFSLTTLIFGALGGAASAKASTVVARHTPVGSLAESLIDNVIRDKVSPVPGSILHCSLYGAEHTGVYVGNGKIINLCGNGSIMVCKPSQFIANSNAISIYVACDKATAKPLGSSKVADRAKAMVGENRSYNVLMDNCHQFTCGCILGEYDNPHNFFWMVEDVISKHLNSGEKIDWRVWDLPTEALFE
jgi:NC domain.